MNVPRVVPYVGGGECRDCGGQGALGCGIQQLAVGREVPRRRDGCIDKRVLRDVGPGGFDVGGVEQGLVESVGAIGPDPSCAGYRATAAQREPGGSVCLQL